MTDQGTRVVNVLSIDVEEYYHATVFQEAVNGVTAGLPSRVVSSTERILELLHARQVKATFFVLGEVGSDHPGLVRRIARDGHEVACHSYHHTLVSDQSPDEFRADIRRAKAVLEDVAGQPVVGYRAPTFSIGASERWAYAILAEEGFRYDSSIYPILHDRYGDRVAPRFPYEIWRSGQRGADRVSHRHDPTLRHQSSDRWRGLFSTPAGPSRRGGNQAGEHGGGEAGDVLLPSLGARSGPAATGHGLASSLPPLRRAGAARGQAGPSAFKRALRDDPRGPRRISPTAGARRDAR